MVDWQQQCVKCGMCSTICPVYKATGREALTARGKMHLLAAGFAENPSFNFQDLFCRCLLCGGCESVCPNALPITKYIVEARATFSPFYGRDGLYKAITTKVLSRPKLLKLLVQSGISLQRLKSLPADSGLRIKLGLLEKRTSAEYDYIQKKDTTLEQPDSGIAYFTGCFARFVQPSIIVAIEKLLLESVSAHPVIFSEQGCCGLAAWSSGSLEEAARLASKNIQAFSEGSGPILTSCASCAMHLRKYPQLFPVDTDMHKKALNFSKRVHNFSEFFLSAGKRGMGFKDTQKSRIYYHDPCHLRFTEKGMSNPRELIDSVDGVVRIDHYEEARCCGHGGTFNLGYSNLSSLIFQQLFNVVNHLDPDLVLTGCSGCLMQWQAELNSRKSKIKALHPAVFLSACLSESD